MSRHQLPSSTCQLLLTPKALSLRHAPLTPTIPPSHLQQQLRHATMLRRPHRPYTFTQLLTLSDGSVTINRTTSPLPIYRSTKDTRNHPMWNPSSQKLANVEEDEAGRLRAFRKRFGRGWDAQATSMEGEEEDGEDGEDGNRDGLREQGDADGFGEQGLADLISGFGYEAQGAKEGNAGEGRSEKGKGKGKEKDKHE